MPIPVRLLPLFCAWLCCLVGSVAAAKSCDAPANTSGRHLPFVDASAKIDADLDDPIWQQALRVPLTIETFPAENTEPPVATEVLLAENGEMLFVAFIAKDPEPDKIRAHYRDRDSAFSDDFVGIVLDTFNDERNAYEFFVNPLGVQMDLTYNDLTGNEDDSWDAIWNSAGRLTEDGFVVEFAIPLRQLRFPDTGETLTWGVNLLRFYPRKSRHRIANVPNDRSRNCYLCQLEKMTGVGCADAGRDLVVAPSLTVNRQQFRDEVLTDPLSDANTDFEPAVDLRWGVSPSLTLIGTLNPDFSQVEADVAQLDVNNTFALFFPEKRPFFLDGQDFFASPNRIVFTRSVADPDAGAKALLKSGPHNLGLFIAHDAKTNYLFPGSEGTDSESSDEENTALATRYRKDVGDNSALGLIFTGRRGDDYHNAVAGLDGTYRFNDQHTVEFQFLRSDTEYPDLIAEDFDQPEEGFGGNLADFAYRYRTREWNGNISIRDTDEGFRADSGFVREVGVKRVDSRLRRIWFPTGSVFNEFGVGVVNDFRRNEQDQLLRSENRVFGFFSGPWQSFMDVTLGKRTQLYDGQSFDLNFGDFFFQIRPRSGLRLELYTRFGDQIDFSNTRAGKILSFNPELEFQIGRHLRMEIEHTYTALDSEDDRKIFRANLTDARLTYQFSTRSFVRLVVQHSDIERDPSLYIEETDARSRSLNSQLLYSYKVNPQTVIFLGYSDATEDGDELTRFTTTDRTVFAKFGYAWLP